MEAKRGIRKVFFVDAAHFVHSSFPGYIWCSKRVFIKTSPGRSRYNVLGALDAVKKTLIGVCNDGYINADSVCELIVKLKDAAEGQPVTLVLDNARYQRCVKVKEAAEELGVELLFLPPYSPNLNLIERLWKFVKNKCLNCRYHETFQQFKDAIAGVLEATGTQFKDELDSLLSWNFQSYSKVKIQA